MIDKQTEEKARKQLPIPSTYSKNYIDIQVPLKNGMHDVVTFAKSQKDGVTIWSALPYAR